MSGHYVKYCKGCDKVMSQCRCPSKDKTVLYGLCEECEKKTMEADND